MQTRTEEPQQDRIQVKAEPEPEEAEEALEVCVGEEGFHVQIKEEPHSQEIGEDCQCDVHQQEEHIKEEHIKEEQHSTRVKEEQEEEQEELWLKEERDSGEEEQEEEQAERGGEAERGGGGGGEAGTGRLVRLLHRVLKLGTRLFISDNSKQREIVSETCCDWVQRHLTPD